MIGDTVKAPDHPGKQIIVESPVRAYEPVLTWAVARRADSANAARRLIFHHGVDLASVSDRNGQSPERCCLSALGVAATVGNTRWPYHSEICGREAGSARRRRMGGWLTLPGGLSWSLLGAAYLARLTRQVRRERR